MAKFVLQGTLYTFYDATIEADSEEEAYAIAEAGQAEWVEVGAGDWEIQHDYMITEKEA